LLAATAALALPSCGRNKGGAGTSRGGGKYVLLDTMTDDGKQEKCKANAEDTLVKHADVHCLVGLWAYNPPAILEAVRDAKKLGKVSIVGFDENEETLQGIRDGHIHGTIVQQPYEFGYQAVKLMAALARGEDKSKVLPKDGILYVPHKVINKDNVEAFHDELKKLKNPATTLGPTGDPAKRVTVAFVTNNPFEFWTIARRGTEKAAAEFNVNVEFHMPARGTAAEQRQIIEDLLIKGVKAIAISPRDADNQAEFFNEVAEKVPLLTQDSDLPKGSKRLCYIGTNNHEAGKAAGELVKEAIPDGGKLVIYVGTLDVQNAVERRQGVMDALGIK
jgi:ribose transport system substrate-binding protein